MVAIINMTAACEQAYVMGQEQGAGIDIDEVELAAGSFDESERAEVARSKHMTGERFNEEILPELRRLAGYAEGEGDYLEERDTVAIRGTTVSENAVSESSMTVPAGNLTGIREAYKDGLTQGLSESLED